MATKAIGSTGPHETWQSGRIGEDADGRTIRHVLTGPYASLEAMTPRKGAKWTDGRTVQSATLEPLRGGMGRLEVTVRIRRRRGSSSGGEGGGPVDLDETLEIEMAQQELDVRTLLGGEESYVCSLAAWEQSEPGLKQQFKFVNANGGEEALGGLAKSVAMLILSGIESVLRFHPVVTRTTYHESEPALKPVGGLGEVGGEPAGSPAGYEYLKTGDHWTESRDGSWTRVEQWTGARNWNGSLYRNGTGKPIDIALLEDEP